MLSAVRIQRALSSESARLGIPFLIQGAVLFALELVQQDLFECFIKVLFNTRRSFLENVELDGVSAVWTLLGDVSIDDLADGEFGRESDHLAVFGDILPVIDKEGLEVIRDEDFDRGAGVEGVLLVL